MCVCNLRYPACNAHAPYCHSVACLAVPHLSTLAHKRNDFQNWKSRDITCVLWIALKLTFKTFHILRRTKRDNINVYWSSCKVPVLVRFHWNVDFLYELSKNTKMWNFLKILPLGAEIHADGQTERDMTKLTVAFRNFANAPKNTHVCVLFISFSPLFPHPFDVYWQFRGALPSTPWSGRLSTVHV